MLRASLDDFQRPWRDRHRHDRLSGEGYYRNASDLDVVRRLLLDPAGSEGSGQVVLCSIDPCWDVRIWVQVDADTSLERCTSRDAGGAGGRRGRQHRCPPTVHRA